jgi:curved DNA-binding protein CbpA
MIDYFALLEQPRKPWLDPAELKEKYHALARQAHPDHDLNEAYRVLVDPKLRLQHLLSLEGTPSSSSSDEIPDDLADLFMEIAPTLNQIEQKQADDLISRLKISYDAAVQDLRELDGKWSQKTPTLIAAAGKLYRRFAFLTRWIGVLEERRFQLPAAS